VTSFPSPTPAARAPQRFVAGMRCRDVAHGARLPRAMLRFSVLALFLIFLDSTAALSLVTVEKLETVAREASRSSSAFGLIKSNSSSGDGRSNASSRASAPNSSVGALVVGATGLSRQQRPRGKEVVTRLLQRRPPPSSDIPSATTGFSDHRRSSAVQKASMAALLSFATHGRSKHGAEPLGKTMADGWHDGNINELSGWKPAAVFDTRLAVVAASPEDAKSKRRKDKDADEGYLFGLPKIFWALVCTILAMLAYVACIPFILTMAKRRPRVTA